MPGFFPEVVVAFDVEVLEMLLVDVVELFEMLLMMLPCAYWEGGRKGNEPEGKNDEADKE